MDIRELMGAVQQLKGSVEAVNKRLDTSDTEANAAAGALRKAFGSVGGSGRIPVVTGWDGASEHTIMSIRSGGRRKTIGNGFGEFLEGVWHSAGNAGGRDPAKGRAILKKHNAEQVTKATNAEGSGPTGGYLVPQQYVPKLFELIAEESFFAALCEHQQMNGLELLWPALNQTSTTASSAAFPSSNFYGGVLHTWAPETTTLAATNPVYRQIKAVARTLGSTTVISNQLLADSAIAMESMVVDLLTKSLGWQLDYAFLRGSGVQMPLGVGNSPGTITQIRGTTTQFNLIDVARMLARINMSSWKNLIWVMNQSVLPQLIQMTNGATNSPFLIWLNPAPNSGDGGPAAQAFPLRLMGIPIYFTEKLPELGTTGDVMLMDASKYLCADRLSVQIESSIHPYFTSYQTVWRTVWRGDGTTMNDGAITLASGTTTVSPFVQLSSATS